MLRKIVCTSAWLIATGISCAIMLKAMGTQEPILSAIGILGVIFAATGVYLAMDARRDGAIIACVLGLGMWVIGELFLLPSEYNFWAATVTAKAEHELDIQRQANGRRLILDAKATKLAHENVTRSPAEIESAIGAALTAPVGKKTLAMVTKGCADISSPAYRYCSEVLKLRGELAVATQRLKDEGTIWEANSLVATNTSEAHGAHDGVTSFADLFGGSSKLWAAILTGLTMLVLAYGRGVTLYVGWRQSKAIVAVALQPAIRGQLEESIQIEILEDETETATAESGKPETAHPKQIATAAKRKWDANEYLEQPETLDDEPEQIDPVQAEIDAIAEQVFSGQAISPGQAHRRVAKIRAAQGLKPLSKKALASRLRRTAETLQAGSRIATTNGRKYGVVAPKEVSAAVAA